MNQAICLSTINLDSETVIFQLTNKLEDAGMRVVRSFDLKSACASYPDTTCPHHGDSPCDCQMVVLLVYGAEATPASVVLHYHQGNTNVELVDTPDNRPDKRLVTMIKLAFETELCSASF